MDIAKAINMKKIEGIQKHTINLYEGDYARIQEMFPDIGAAAIIRKLVRRFVEQSGNYTDILPSVEIKL